MRTIRLSAVVASLFLVASSSLLAQNKISISNSTERIWCVVKMVGSGTLTDPRRPMYAPIASVVSTKAADPSSVKNAIISYTYQVSDDGQYALVQFVGQSRAAFSAILADRDPNTKVFLPGRDTREAMEAEFKKYKKNIDLSRVGVMVP